MKRRRLLLDRSVSHCNRGHANSYCIEEYYRAHLALRRGVCSNHAVVVSRNIMIRATIPLLAIGLLASTPSLAGALYPAPPAVIATLPKYCLGQYMEGMKGRPGYSIEGCGDYANHYCPGLVDMAQATTAQDNSKKRFYLESAKQNMEYTLNFTKNIPSCFLRTEAASRLQIIQMKLRLMR